MDMINGAIENLMSSAGKEDWTPVLLNVADATVTVFKEKVKEISKCPPEIFSNLSTAKADV